MESAPAGLTEHGVPPYVVHGIEALGLRNAPTDLQVLPDGRLLLVAQNEFAIGDGLRWETFRNASYSAQAPVLCNTMGIGSHGELYRGVPNGFARISFDLRGNWLPELVSTLPPSEGLENLSLGYLSRVAGRWLWYSGGGAVVAWKPNESPKLLGRVKGEIGCIFELKGTIYLTNGTTGAIERINGDHFESVYSTGTLGSAVVCSVPYDKDHVLVGTKALGFRLFDGSKLEAFVETGALTESCFVSDICEVQPGLYAAAIAQRGIVFFSHNGRVVQFLDQANDRRLSQVQSLRMQRGNVLWGLLPDGVVRIEFPSRYSFFEPLLSLGLAYVQPVRYQGRLWMIADGRARRGVYDADGRLVSFADDTPPGAYLHCLVAFGDRLLASNETGVFQYAPDGWRRLSDISPNVRLLPMPDGNRLLYLASGEFGWIHFNGENCSFERFKDPKLEVNFGAIIDAEGVVWLEYGPGLIGRLDLNAPTPQSETYGQRDGLPDYWVSVCILDGKAYCARYPQMLAFDKASRRFVVDEAIIKKYPGLARCGGNRPIIDARGRLWLTSEDTALSFSTQPGRETEPPERIAVSFRAYEFTAEDQGVVWIQQKGRLIRYDPSVPSSAGSTPHVVISRIQFPNSNRVLVSPGPVIDPVAFDDNSLVVHLMAPTAGFSFASGFEVKLDGSGGDWVSIGTGNSAVFSRLKEGNYVLHVRASQMGDDASIGNAGTSLAFEIRPPWFRTSGAFIVFIFVCIGLLAVAIFLPLELQRRKKALLEELVARRTSELNETNLRLAKQVELSTAKSAALSESEERYRALYENNPAMYFTLDRTGRIRSVNQSGAEQLGYEPSELADRNILDLFHSDDRPEVAKNLDLCLRSPGSLRSWQLRRLRKDGGLLYVREQARAVSQGREGLVLLLVCQDITAQTKLEEQLRQVQKMDALGQLAGGVAHDFNNLLTVILGHVEEHEDPSTEPGEKLESIAQIREAARRASNLTRQLLVFSHQQAMRPVRANLNDVVFNLSKMLKRLIGEDISLHISLPSDAIFVQADVGMIEQVIVNMAVNARDAMPRGGVLDISTRALAVPGKGPSAKGGDGASPHACIRIADTGAGIPPAVLARVFDAFFTTKDPGKGTGLGLAVSHSIISQHNGWIDVESREGIGTEFRIYLPLCPDEAVATAAAVQSSAPVRGSGTILLVEDEPGVRRVTQRILSKQGYRVLEAANGDEALLVWRSHASEIHLLLTDIVMPGNYTGRTLAYSLLKEAPSLRVCFMSGHDAEMLALKAGDAPSMPLHLQKPFTSERLLQVVRECMA